MARRLGGKVDAGRPTAVEEHGRRFDDLQVESGRGATGGGCEFHVSGATHTVGIPSPPPHQCRAWRT